MARKGSAIELRDSSIRLTFQFEGQTFRKTLMVNGKAMAPTLANQKFAQRLALEIKDKIRYDVFCMAEYFPTEGDGGALTLAVHLQNWLLTQMIEKSTKDGYQTGINFWTKSICNTQGTILGGLLLRAIKVSHIRTAMAARRDLSGKTLNNYASVLREALSLAVDDGLITDNPMSHIKPVPHQKDPPDPFSREEADLIAARFDQIYPGQVANYVRFWLYTGVRTSELTGLQWRNVDLNSGSIMVREATVRGVHKDKTKTNVARTIKLNSRALAALEAQRALTQLKGGAVFQDPRYDEPWNDERAFRRSYWTPVLTFLGIRYRRPYNMRHTYATLMLMAGANHSWCAKQLGHSVDQFQRTYTKWIDGEQNDRELDLIESALAPVRRQTHAH